VKLTKYKYIECTNATYQVKNVQVKITWTGKHFYEKYFSTYNNISPSTVYINQVGSPALYFSKIGNSGNTPILRSMSDMDRFR